MPKLPAGGSRIRRPARVLAVALTLVLVGAGCAGAGDDEGPPLATLPSSPAETVSTVPATVGNEAATASLDLQGHRGARGLRPENTLPSFEAALDLGVTTLEMDLHLSSDDAVIVWHDAVIDPSKCRVDPDVATDPPDPDDPGLSTDELMIRNLTAVEIRSYRCDRNPDPDRFPEQSATAEELAGDDYHIPTLEEVLRFVDEYSASDLKSAEQRANAAVVGFNIETKRRADQPETIGDGFDGENPGPFEHAVLAAVQQAGVADRTTIQSFDHRSLWAIRSLDGTVRLAALTLPGHIPDVAELADGGAAVWSPDFRSATRDAIDAAHGAGLAVIAWTVNDPDDMQALIDLGVDGIITDRPDLAPLP